MSASLPPSLSSSSSFPPSSAPLSPPAPLPAFALISCLVEGAKGGWGIDLAAEINFAGCL